MSFSSGEAITASDYINLKNRVKNEMLRRKYTGSLVAYGGAAYDYSTQPTSNSPVLAEHQTKIATPINAIKTSISAANRGATITSLSTINTILAAHEAQAYTAVSDCASSCSGLCSTACTNDCSLGCSNDCTSSCSGSCTGTCTGSCSGGCSGCGGNCSGTCNTTCKGSCSGGCGGTCKGKCKGTCTINCAPTCANGPGWN